MAEPSAGEQAAAASLLGAMTPDLLGELHDAIEKSASGEDFVNRIMVGDCPQCGCEQTGDCENDPEIDDPCVGRCFECGQLWCLDCGLFFKDAHQPVDHDCPAWADMDMDLDDEDFGESDDVVS